MNAGESLCRLVCGAIDEESAERCELRDVLSYVSAAIKNCVDDISWVFKQNEGRISRYAPFLARSILELGATALIGRLDPTRVLVVKRMQEQPGYSPDRVWKSAIRWQGDVVAEKVNALWADSVAPKDITRALVGDYYANLYWRPAMDKLADSDSSGAGEWAADLKRMTADQFIGARRNTLVAIFSQSSKAIHHELVVPASSMFDVATSKQLLTKVMQSLCEFGLLINFLPHTPYRLSYEETFEAIAAIEKYEVGA